MESCPNIDIALLKAGDKTASSSSSPATWCSTRLTAAQKAPVRDGRHTVKGVVTDATGQPGEAAQIRVRGTGSISASAAPLYVVDGIPGGSFNPNDVESISVLKDAGATAIYGSDAAGGTYTIDVPIDRLPLFEKL